VRLRIERALRARRAVGLLLAAAVVLASRCGGGLKTISQDGYTATLAYSSDERYKVAVRGESRRVEGPADGGTLIKIARPDLRTVWQIRPEGKKLFAAPWSATDEIVPGYPLEPNFDPAAYADRFGGQIQRIGDDTHGLHPCDRWRMTLPSGDSVTIWAARDLERLVVKIEHTKKDQSDESQPFTTTELLDVRIGAKPELFEQPRGYVVVKSYAELMK
jgi:hypothetical protein